MMSRPQKRREKPKGGDESATATQRALDLILTSTEHEPSITKQSLLDLRASGVRVKPDREGYVRIGGFPVRIRVIDRRDIPAVDLDYVVCKLWNDGPQEYLDNVRGVCVRCFRDVRHRPHVPPNLKKICVECLPGRLQN